MWKPLFLKELRDTSLTLGVTAAALALWLAEMTGWGFFTASYNFDIISVAPLSSANQWFVLILAASAVALGMQQTILESSRQTWLFLLHRPVPRNVIPLTKWLTGLTTWLVLALVPFACYLIWAASDGKHASPFVWGNTYSWWQTVAGLSVVYSGAFLAGLRPAHWLGTRLLPLAGTGLWVMICWQVDEYRGWGCFLLILASVALHAVLLKLILDESAERDYP